MSEQQIERWEPALFNDGDLADMDREPDGAWVRYADYTADLARLRAIEAAANELATKWERTPNPDGPTRDFGWGEVAGIRACGKQLLAALAPKEAPRG